MPALAGELGHDGVVALLQATLDEEGAADKLLTQIAEGEVLLAASAAGGEDDDEEDDDE